MMAKLPDTLLQGGILEATDEVAFDDLVDAARAASSRHPHLTAEIWRGGRKAAVVKPCWNHRDMKWPQQQRQERAADFFGARNQFGGKEFLI